MTPTMRKYTGDEDYWRIREFLRRVTLLNGLREQSWHVARWDYWWWFGNPDLEQIPLTENVFIWENEAGQIAAVLNPEQAGQVFPQVDPRFRSHELEEELIAVAEERLTATGRSGRPKLWLWTDSTDQLRQGMLAGRGFHRVELPEEQEVQHRRLLDEPLPAAPHVPGYAVRAQGDGLELLERCYAAGLGFHDDDTGVARENRDRPEWYPSHPVRAAVPPRPGPGRRRRRRVDRFVLHYLVRRRHPHRLLRAGGHRAGPPAAWTGQGGDARRTAPPEAHGGKGGVCRRILAGGECLVLFGDGPGI